MLEECRQVVLSPPPKTYTTFVESAMEQQEKLTNNTPLNFRNNGPSVKTPERICIACNGPLSPEVPVDIMICRGCAWKLIGVPEEKDRYYKKDFPD